MQQPPSLPKMAGRMFLEMQGLGEINDEIHPKDDMLRVLRATHGERTELDQFIYLKSGFEVILAIKNLLEALGRPESAVATVLDFACGYGRVTRFLANGFPGASLTCSDILPDAVDFVSTTWDAHGVVSTADSASFVIEERFDLIIVSSLFSHLPMPRFRAWLHRLYSLLSPSGILLFSTHGMNARPGIPRNGDGFTFVPESETDRLDTCEYGSAFVEPQVVSRIAGEVGILNIAGLERELWRMQDLYVASPSPLAGIERWTHSTTIQGRIDVLSAEAGGWFHASGWAVDSRLGAPLAEVRLHALGQEGKATLAQPRPDVAQDFARAECLASGWTLSGCVAIPPEGALVAAIGSTHTGFIGCFDVRPICRK